MNVLNVHELERELNRYAARCCHEPACRWVKTVARNYLLNKLPDKDIQSNYRVVTFAKTNNTAFHVVNQKDMPEWALPAIADKSLLWFDPIQPRRREVWNVIDIIVMWFNNWKATDTRLRRIDRIAFPVATSAAILWYKDVSENIWNYVTDKPVVVKTYEHGFHWVKLVSTLQFEREGKLMKHCVGNGTYFNRWRQTREAEYYSLRDRHNKPHATMEVLFDGSHPIVRKGLVNQCKGNSNHKPAGEYQRYIRRFIDDMKWGIGGDHGMID